MTETLTGYMRFTEDRTVGPHCETIRDGNTDIYFVGRIGKRICIKDGLGNKIRISPDAAMDLADAIMNAADEALVESLRK